MALLLNRIFLQPLIHLMIDRNNNSEGAQVKPFRYPIVNVSRCLNPAKKKCIIGSKKQRARDSCHWHVIALAGTEIVGRLSIIAGRVPQVKC